MAFVSTQVNPFSYGVSNKQWNVADVVSDQAGRKWVFDHADEIEDIIADAKAKKEHQKLLHRQAINKYYRSLIKHVKFSGDACIAYWNDGTETVVRWDRREPYDPEKAILAAMAKKLYGGTNIYCEVLKKYEDDGWIHYDEELEDWDGVPSDVLKSWQTLALKDDDDEDYFEFI